MAKKTPDERREDFGRALADALAVNEITQKAFGESLADPKSQAAISDWVLGRAEPMPYVVFAAEGVLGLAPGSLSRHLGYLPEAAVKNVVDVEAAILGDGALSVELKNALLGAYRAALAGNRARRGRPSGARRDR